MRNLGILIIDDERSARELVKSLLEGTAWINILGEAENTEEALPLILKTKPDVLLLDIQMPRRDGFALVEDLVKHNIQVNIIFITAYEKYAIKAIKSSAFDYLLKPIKKLDLIDSLQRVREKLTSDQKGEQFTHLISLLNTQKKLKFKNRTGFSMIDTDEIIYCEADSNYSILELDSGKKHVVSMNLGKIEELLPPESFCRISRSVVVNIKYLTHVDRKSMKCELVNSSSHSLSISRKYLRALELSCDKLFRN